MAMENSGGSAVKKEEDHDHVEMNIDDDHNKKSPSSMMEISTHEFSSSLSPSTQKAQDDLLKSTKAEMGEVMEENQKLKLYLDRVMKDYRALQMQFHEMIQQEPNKSSSTITTSPTHHENEEPEFISLSLGRSSSNDHGKKSDKMNTISYGKEKIEEEKDDDDKEGLALGLDCKFDQLPNKNGKSQSQSHDEHSPNQSLETTQTSSGEAKEEAGGTWPPQKGLKTARSGGEDEVSHEQNPTKRARVSVRVRCDTPNMNDGCQWRKYGQKIAKGNPCPRAYYRCTVAPNCPVRKQVQRCAEDMSILITTYEGTHSHPLPISATAMASTTSAAASMLLSGSTSSSSGTLSATSFPSSTNTTAITGTLNGLNFYLSDNSRPKPFYLPNSSLSSTPSFPTITLDLTTNPSAASHLNRLSSPNTFPPRYSSTNLNFSSLQESNSLPLSWSTTNYASGTTQPFNRSAFLNTSSLNFGSRQSQETPYQNYFQKHMQQQNNLTSDPIAAATKAITSDPSFQSALAAALTSIMGSGNVATNQTSSEKPVSPINMKVMDHQASFPVLSSFQSSSAAPNANRCAPSFLSSKPSTPSSANNSSQTAGNMMFLSTPNGNNASSPSHENRDHIS